MRPQDMAALAATVILLTLYAGHSTIAHTKFGLVRAKGHEKIRFESKNRIIREQKKLKPQPHAMGNPFHHIHALDINGRIVDMGTFKNKVVMIINVASHDSKTKQFYTDLQAMYEKYEAHGLRILAFPCNQFGGEEAGTNEEIKKYVDLHYHPDFTLMSKVHVNGPNSIPLYRLLKSAFPGAIKWNFGATFLIDLHGRIVKRSRLMPKQLEPVISDLLQNRRLTAGQASRD
eukprot:m.166736 g.166736  ORF g.166736 m.166736 type:complete len:231 (-) comp31438_c6_seq1:310-1002(-)